jgi:hypothetical protein
MMNEIKGVRQHKGEHRRRWFFDREMDLTVWIDDDDRVIGFQILYDRPLDPHALTWFEGKGFFHNRVDDGKCPGTLSRKGTPILLPDGQFDAASVCEIFKAKSKDIDSEIAGFVIDTLLNST